MSDYIAFKLWKLGIFVALAAIYGAIKGFREGINQKRRPERTEQDTQADSDS